MTSVHHPAQPQEKPATFGVTQAGSLPRSPELVAANAAREFEEDGFTLKPSAEAEQLLQGAVVDIVKRQVQLGITLPGDGEYGHAMTSAVDYGAWWSYIFQRVGGLALTDEDHFTSAPVQSTPGNPQLTNMNSRRDWVRFRAAYADPEAGISLGSMATAFPSTTEALYWRGTEAITADIKNLQAGLQAAGAHTGFLTALSPGTAARIPNRHYASEREHIFAWAEVLREEYRAITDAGLIVQIDDPSLAENWDQITPEPTVQDYREFTQVRVDALNHALRGLPEDQVRLHVCWGSWHGPHTTDLEFKHIVDLVLAVNAGSYSFEAGNVRHEHEFTVWDDVELPAGKTIAPGVVSHATNVVEHPELVAQRLLRFAERVGPENVLGSTDCGLGGRLHPDIAFAKLAALGEGAALARQRI